MRMSAVQFLPGYHWRIRGSNKSVSVHEPMGTVLKSDVAIRYSVLTRCYRLASGQATELLRNLAWHPCVVVAAATDNHSDGC